MHGTKAFLSMPGFIPKERDEEEGGGGVQGGGQEGRSLLGGIDFSSLAGEGGRRKNWASVLLFGFYLLSFLFFPPTFHHRPGKCWNQISFSTQAEKISFFLFVPCNTRQNEFLTSYHNI